MRHSFKKKTPARGIKQPKPMNTEVEEKVALYLLFCFLSKVFSANAFKITIFYAQQKAEPPRIIIFA